MRKLKSGKAVKHYHFLKFYNTFLHVLKNATQEAERAHTDARAAAVCVQHFTISVLGVMARGAGYPGKKTIAQIIAIIFVLE